MTESSEHSPQTPSAPPSGPWLSRGIILFMATATGLAVANNYYIQPLLDTIAATFGISAATAGNLVTIGQVGYALGLVFLLPIGDMVEQRRLIVIMALATAASCVGAALAPSAALLALSIGILCVATVFAQMLVPLASSLAAPDRRGDAVGTVMSGLLLGILLARTFAGAIAELAGWRAVYLLSAVLMVACALGLRWALPRVPANATGHAADGSRRSPVRRYSAVLASTLTLIRTLPALRYRMTVGALNFALFSILWTPLTFLLASQAFGWSEGAIGAMGLVGAVGALGARLGGRFADQGRGVETGFLGSWAMLLGWVIILAGGTIALGSTPVAVTALILGVIVLDFGVQILHVSNQNVVFSLGEQRNRLNSAYMGAYFVGGSVGTILSTLAWSQWGWWGVGLLGVLLGLASVVITRPAVQRRWAPTAQR